jgi:hypothetical protein
MSMHDMTRLDTHASPLNVSDNDDNDGCYPIAFLYLICRIGHHAPDRRRRLPSLTLLALGFNLQQPYMDRDAIMLRILYMDQCHSSILDQRKHCLRHNVVNVLLLLTNAIRNTTYRRHNTYSTDAVLTSRVLLKFHSELLGLDPTSHHITSHHSNAIVARCHSLSLPELIYW